jgi:hypothetical protein
MSALVEFLDRLLTDGTALLRVRPDAEPRDRVEAADRLAAAYELYRLDVPGRPPPFAAQAALAAGEFFRWACWFLLHRHEPAEEVEKAMVPLPPPATAADHLSADLVLRLLPAIYRRARAANPADVLTRRLAHALRQAPLSGVLSDVEEGPLVAVELGGHAGLLLLYAERLAAHLRPEWVPDGPARPYVELVFAHRGLHLPQIRAAATAVESP